MKSKKFVLAGLVLLATIITGLTLTGCETEVDPSTPQQEQPDGNTGNSGEGNTQQPGGDNSGNEDEVGGEKPVTYTVTFNANGGTGTMESQTFTAGTTQPLSANEFQRSGWAFNGWNTMADGSGASYVDKASFTATEDTTLYAKWRVTAAAGIAAVVVAEDGITRTDHATLMDAVSDAFKKNGSTLYMVEDYLEGQVVYIKPEIGASDGSFTLDLNGKVMKNESGYALITEQVSLTITDTFGGGRIISRGLVCIENTSSSTLKIKGVSIEGTTYGVHNRGSMTVAGGSISVTGDEAEDNSFAVLNSESGTLTITGGNISNDNGNGVGNSGTLILSGNPRISGDGVRSDNGLPNAGIYLDSEGSIAGSLTAPITVSAVISHLVSGASWTAFQGTGGYQITDDDLKKLQPVVTDLGYATLSTALEGNAIVVKVTPKQ